MTEVAALSDLLAGERLVEIVGPGGIGKTAVAIAVGRGLARRRPTAIWLARLETAATADDVVDVLVSAVDGPGGEEALFERLKDVLRPGDPRQLRARHRRCRCPGGAPPRRRTRAADPVHQSGATRHRRRGRLRARAAGPLRRCRAVHPPCHCSTPESHREARTSDGVRDLCRSLDGLPLAIELAAARTKTLSVEEITRRLDDRFLVLSDPTSRRPERRRSLRSTIGWSYDLLFPDDQRGLWALATFAGGAPLPAVEFVLEALDVPAAAAIDVVGRLASRSLVIVDDEGHAVLTAVGPADPGSLPAARQHPGVRARGHDRRGAGRSCPCGPRRMVRRAAGFSTEGVRSRRQAEHLSFARTERANIDAALAWGAVHDPMLALGIVNGFGWAWVVLGDSRGAQRS